MAAGSMANMSLNTRYAPPEILAANRAGERRVEVAPAVDIWAVGVMAVELLAGERAFKRVRNTANPSRGHSAAGPSYLTQVDPHAWELSSAAEQALGILPGLSAAVLSCLALDPVQRPSAAALGRTWRRLVLQSLQ